MTQQTAPKGSPAAVAILVVAIGMIVFPLIWWMRELLQVLSPPLDATYVGLYLPARGFALVGFVLMFYQFVLSAHLPPLERVWKRHKLIGAHRTIGKIGFLLMLLHGVMMLTYDLVLMGQIVLYTEKTLGLIALVLLMIAVAAAWFFKPLRLPLKTWRAIHLLAYFVFPLVFHHGVSIGTTLNSARPVYWLFVVLFGVYALLVIYRIVRLFTDRAGRKPAST